MKKVAILMDGGFVNKVIGFKGPSASKPDPIAHAARLVRVAHACIEADEEIFRIFYYDCAPYAGKRVDLSGHVVDFAAKVQFDYQTQLLTALGKQPFTAIRLGQVRFRGWKPRKHVMSRLRRSPNSLMLSAKDFEANFQQKGVDMRVGIDVATLSMERLVDRIILVAADSDFIPAMKLARRAGVQVALAALGKEHVPELLDHVDLYRYPDLSNL